MAQLMDAVHVSALVQVGLFVPTHILGTVLIGVVALRHHLAPTPVAWALIVSQPLHLAAVLTGLPALDLAASSLTGLGVAWLAARPPLPALSPTSAPARTSTPVAA